MSAINVLHNCNGKMMAITIAIVDGKGTAVCPTCTHIFTAEWKGGRRYRCIDTSAENSKSTPKDGE